MEMVSKDSNTNNLRVAVDIGGTFTDVVVLDEVTGSILYDKVETNPGNPAAGVFEALDKTEVDLGSLNYFVHGTTLGINALLTRSGSKVAIVTTKGFRDVYLLGRTDREPMYDLKYRKAETLVPRHLCFEVEERLDFRGNVLIPFNEAHAIQVAEQVRAMDVEAIAVCFLHSYVNAEHENSMAKVLQEVFPAVSVTLSHQLSKEYREYERTSTTVCDAYVKPITRKYLGKLSASLDGEGFHGQFLLTRSGGGAMTVEEARDQPVQLILSGPAGGVMGAAEFGSLIGQNNLITIDMGGTSLDASLVIEGSPQLVRRHTFQGLPISIPTISVHTIGAGGGSIAWIDDGDHLQVGPQSAGATPGPACYNRGGVHPTFTDAALVLGYIDPGNYLGGSISLDSNLSSQALGVLADLLGMSVQEAAAGIVRITIAKITGAVRVISIEQGLDPRDFSLLVYGGAGALVGSAVARELEIPTMVIPIAPATFSALGMLTIDVVHDYSQTYITALDQIDYDVLNGIYQTLMDRGRKALTRDGINEAAWKFLPTAEMRYQGQEHTVSIPMPSHRLQDYDTDNIMKMFGDVHLKHYGHKMDDPVEIVTLCLRSVGVLPRPEVPRLDVNECHTVRERDTNRLVYRSAEEGIIEYKIYNRRNLVSGSRVTGPAIIEETSSTTILHTGDEADVGSYGELLISPCST